MSKVVKKGRILIVVGLSIVVILAAIAVKDYVVQRLAQQARDGLPRTLGLAASLASHLVRSNPARLLSAWPRTCPRAPAT